ncbi:hypothetical protein GCM10009574_027500 [Streptomyces asiaticus]|uniref:Uncharacterized protein n=2 Tax=Streptomyces rhizosphaericus TaxID=114699 RepID=A0ABN1SPZ2_9ACTN
MARAPEGTTTTASAAQNAIAAGGMTHTSVEAGRRPPGDVPPPDEVPAKTMGILKNSEEKMSAKTRAMNQPVMGPGA